MAVLCILLIVLATNAYSSNDDDRWIVVVGSSRFWANYRHTANSLAVCDMAKRMGVPSSHLISMIAEPCACSPRNPYRGQIYFDGRLERNIAAGGGVDQSSYGRERANPQTLKDVLLGKRAGLDSGPNSSIVLYLTGHGGDEFLKFHDSDEISAYEIAEVLREMRRLRRYRQLLLIIDTCQAASLFRYLDHDSGILGIASSVLGENAYATPPDPDVGIALADRFTYYFIQFFEHFLIDHNCDYSTCQRHNSLGAIIDYLKTARTRSTLQIHDVSWGDIPWRDIPLTDFFGKGPRSASGNREEDSTYVVSPLLKSIDLLAVFGHLSNGSR